LSKDSTRIDAEVINAFANLIIKSRDQAEVIKLQNVVYTNIININSKLTRSNVECSIKLDDKDKKLSQALFERDFYRKIKNKPLKWLIPALVVSLGVNYLQSR
jgi:hypothetical protein